MLYFILIGIIGFLLYKEYRYDKKIKTILSFFGFLTGAFITRLEDEPAKKEEAFRKELLRIFAYHYNHFSNFEHNAFWETVCKNYNSPIYVDQSGNVSAKVVDDLAHRLAIGSEPLEGIYKAYASKLTVEELEEMAHYNIKQTMR